MRGISKKKKKTETCGPSSMSRCSKIQNFGGRVGRWEVRMRQECMSDIVLEVITKRCYVFLWDCGPVKMREL